MKILYVSSHPFLNVNADTGYGTHIRKTVEGFVALGHEVKVVSACKEISGGTTTGNNNSPKGKSFLKKLIPTFIWETLKDIRWLKWSSVFRKEVENAIREFDPDLVYERGIYLMRPVRKSPAGKFRYFLEINAPLLEEKRKMSGFSLLDAFQKRRSGKQFASADYLITVSSVLRDHFIRQFQLEEHKVLYLPNAVDPSEVKTDQDLMVRLQKQFGITNKRVIGFIGSMFPYHGVDLLIRAFSKRSSANESLMLVGDGYVVEELKQLASQLGISAKVIFTGRIPHKEVYSYMALMEICVMPASNWYGSPVKIFEYGAMSKPIIAPDNGPVCDVMQNGVDGLLVKNEVELGNAMKRMLDDREGAMAMALHFHSKVMQHYTWHNNSKEICKLASNLSTL